MVTEVTRCGEGVVASHTRITLRFQKAKIKMYRPAIEVLKQFRKHMNF